MNDIKQMIKEHGRLKGIIKELQNETYEGPISLEWIVDILRQFDIVDSDLKFIYSEVAYV